MKQCSIISHISISSETQASDDEATITLRHPNQKSSQEYSKEGTFTALQAAFTLASEFKILLQWASGELSLDLGADQWLICI